MGSVLQSQHWLNPGNELWVISERLPKPMLIKLNWHLNFQLAKGLRKKHFELTPKMKWWLSQTEIDSDTISLKDPRDLTIGCQNLLPCRWVSLVHCDIAPDDNSAKISEHMLEWSRKIHLMWKNLKYPTLRIFAPDEIEFTPFDLEWKKLDVIGEYSFVVTGAKGKA